MAGKIGRSGRKSLKVELHKEIDLQTLWHLSSKILIDALNDPDLPQGKKIEISQALVLKMCPQELKHGGNKEDPLIIKWET